MKKPQLHASGIRLFLDCGVAFMRRYILGEKIPPPAAIVVGVAAHKSIETNLNAKIETGKLLDYDMCEDIARDSVNEQWEQGVTEEEVSQGEAIDLATGHAKVHRRSLAPKLDPVAVEQKWVVETPYSVDLAGTIDVVESNGNLRDTKTSKRKPPKGVADKSDQVTAYSFAKRITTGQIPEAVHLDYLVPKQKSVITVSTCRDAQDIKAFTQLLESVSKLMDSEIYLPAAESSWMCSQKWCGYWDTCPFARGRARVKS